MINRLVRQLQNAVRAIYNHGAASTIKAYAHRAREAVQDRYHGIESTDIISPTELDLQHPDMRGYIPTDYLDFEYIARYLRPKSENEVLLDYGCGLGRVILLASRFPFRRIIGIELAPTLVARARRNIESFSGQRACSDIQVLLADASTYPLPDDVTAIYFNNPFSGVVLANVVTNIQGSLERRPRSLRLLCNLPAVSAFDAEIRAVPWLSVEHEALRGQRRIVILKYITRE